MVVRKALNVGVHYFGGMGGEVLSSLTKSFNFFVLHQVIGQDQ